MLLACDNTEDECGSSLEFEELSTGPLMDKVIEGCDLDG